MAGILLRSIATLGRRSGTSARLLQNVNVVAGTQLGRRTLFEEVDEQVRNQEKIKDIYLEKIGEQKNLFIDEMKSTLDANVYTEDMKTMANIAETDEEIDLTLKMLYRWYDYFTSQQRTPSFTMGPVVMRVLHRTKNPDKALEAYRERPRLFTNMASVLTLLDMLYERKRFKECLEVIDFHTESMNYASVLGNMSLVAIGSCHQLGTEGYNKLKQYIADILKEGTNIPYRCQSLAILQAIDKQDYELADTWLQYFKPKGNPDFEPRGNVELMLLCRQGQFDKALELTTKILQGEGSPLSLSVITEVANGLTDPDQQKQMADVIREAKEYRNKIEPQGTLERNLLFKRMRLPKSKRPEPFEADRAGRRY